MSKSRERIGQED
jgi:hypothetical protein